MNTILRRWKPKALAGARFEVHSGGYRANPALANAYMLDLLYRASAALMEQAGGGGANVERMRIQLDPKAPPPAASFPQSPDSIRSRG